MNTLLSTTPAPPTKTRRRPRPAPALPPDPYPSHEPEVELAVCRACGWQAVCPPADLPRRCPECGHKLSLAD